LSQIFPALATHLGGEARLRFGYSDRAMAVLVRFQWAETTISAAMAEGVAFWQRSKEVRA